METSLVKFNSGWISVRHTDALQSRRTILFIHGLGDSSLSFSEAFEAPDLEIFNLVAPDLMGHGCSSNAPDEDYSFDSHIKSLSKLVDEFGMSKFFLVGHSMGGDIATHFAATDKGGIRGLINIEGNLTPPDVFISNLAVEAAERGGFDTWFKNDFMNKMVLNEWGAKWASCKRYYASLWFCRAQAFLSSAREVVRQNSAVPNTSETKTGSLFKQIKIPKVYCWGKGIPEQTRKLLEENKTIEGWGFEDSSHWPMIDEGKEFYYRLAQFCSDK